MAPSFVRITPKMASPAFASRTRRSPMSPFPMSKLHARSYLVSSKVLTRGRSWVRTSEIFEGEGEESRIEDVTHSWWLIPHMIYMWFLNTSLVLGLGVHKRFLKVKGTKKAGASEDEDLPSITNIQRLAIPANIFLLSADFDHWFWSGRRPRNGTYSECLSTRLFSDTL